MADPIFKFGAPSRRRLEQLRKERDPGDRVSMILRLAALLSPEQAALLKDDGAVVRTRAGTIVTIDAPLGAIEPLLRHEFIVAAELSSPLYPDGRQPT